MGQNKECRVENTLNLNSNSVMENQISANDFEHCRTNPNKNRRVWKCYKSNKRLDENKVAYGCIFFGKLINVCVCLLEMCEYVSSQLFY